MYQFMHQLLFGYFPYIALTVFLVGSLIRFDAAQYGWRSGSSQLLSGRLLRVGSNFFHVGILLLFGGHFVGLLTPHEVYEALGLSAQAKQLLAMTAGGVFGTLCLIGMTLLLYRRLTVPRIRATSSRMDVLILLLLYLQLLLGLATIPVSAQHPDGSEMLRLAAWAQHIVTFRTDAAGLIDDVNPVFLLHILLGLIIFLLFPFSRLVHIWSAPIWYLGRHYQIVRRRGGAAAVRTR